jgi:two-component system, chemotaxis family, CheB/CheR fusion protein
MKQASRDVKGDLEPSHVASFSRLTGPALFETGGYFREVLQALPAAVYITDLEGRITFYNEAAAALWGRHPELGKSEWCGSWKLWRPDGRPLPHDQCPMALTLKQKQPVRGIEAVAERPDGSRVPFIPFPTLLYDEAGAVVGAVNLLVDITDRKRAEEHAQRLTSIVENSDDAIVSKDLNGIITSWNSAAERLFGYSAEEVIGKSITILMPSDRQREELEILEHIGRGERVGRYETIRRRKDGSLVDISLTVSPVRDVDGNIIGASKIARDISGRKRAAEQQQLLVHELEHRVKNSLATVQAIATQTLRGASAEERAAFTGRILALASAQDLLKGQSWNQAALRDVVVQTLKAFEEKHRDRFHIDGPDDVWLDATKCSRLTMVLHELATNAIKYGALSNNAGHVSVSWEVSRDEQLTCVTIRWSEHGGPPVEPPKERGFGSLLIEKALAGEAGKAQLEFIPVGLVCTIEMLF